MQKISLLDCTLRDGGYVNNWKFGNSRIHSILKRLTESHVEYIECGYLNEQCEFSPDSTKFPDFAAVKAVLPEQTKNQHFTVMIDFGTYNINHLPVPSEYIPAIRVCFHKKDAEKAIIFCEQLIKKGYEVFVQPMVSMSYSDEEFLQLIQKINKITPACFYIVDSFGSMELPDFQRLLFLTDHNLSQDILLGYHAHNNLQQAYENAKYMVEAKLSHDILLDASVYGMGRGAGNLNVEIFASYLNTNCGKAYDINCFLEIIDEDLKPIFSENYWGYSLPFYLSAKYRCHPSYAAYFADKNSLSYKSLAQLLASLPENIKISFSKEMAEHYYREFVQCSIDDRETISLLRKMMENHDVLILAPGKSLRIEKMKIENYISRHDCVIIAVGVLPDKFGCDYLFCSSERRFKHINFTDDYKVILTSNVQTDYSKCIRVNYASYLMGNGLVADNPVLMVLQMLIAMEIKEVAIAGFDGYRFTASENYFAPELAMGSSIENKIERNKLISEAIKRLASCISINFITKSLYTD